MAHLINDEDERVANLVEAQRRAVDLFAAIEERELLEPGMTESQASDAIRDLAAQMFGVSRHWHKRIVRAGLNTRLTFEQNPPERVIETDDIVFCDFGPVFAEWEADFGRTFVFGDDSIKKRLRDALPVIFDAGRQYFQTHPDVTGEQLFARVTELAREAGWEFGGRIAGHLVGQFPHDKIAGNKIDYYVTPGSSKPMRRTDSAGLQCHWILEVHLVDRSRQFGGFFEELLDIGDGSR